MIHYLLVFIGSGLGGLTRFATSRFVQIWWKDAFPLPTLLINMLACFILGYVAGKTQQKGLYNTEAQLLLITGFCGGFSTFSSFSYENLKLLETQQYMYAVAYTLFSVLLCLLLVFIGYRLGS
jgi:CrcB protein